MNEGQTQELIIKISTSLAELNVNMRNVLDTLAKHEGRLAKLEDGHIGMKDMTIQWLVKGLIASILTIGSLTGAGSLLKHIFTM